MNRNACPPVLDTGSRAIRVAYVVHTFHVGGLERCIARLANHLDQQRFESRIICLNKNSDAAAWIERDDVPIVELRKRSGNDLRVIIRLACALRDAQIDIVHSHNWGTLLETCLARRIARTPCHVHAERGMELEDLRVRSVRHKLRGFVARWALNRADAIVAVAEAVKENIRTRCGDLRTAIQVIPNGIDLPRVSPDAPSDAEIRERLGIATDAILLGSVGRLAAVKDFPNAVRVVKRLIEQGIDSHLVLVGDGPERHSIAKQANSMGISARVHLVGQQSDVAAWLAAMDVYLNVSLNEGMSQSILEAMACGLPMVVTDVGDNRRLVGGENACGEVVATPGADGLVEAVKRIIASPSLRAEYRANALARFEADYQIEGMIDAYESLYCRLTEKALPSDTSSIS